MNPIQLSILVFGAHLVVAGCLSPTEPTPLTDSRLRLDVSPVEPMRSSEGNEAILELVNDGPEAAKVDPLTIGGSRDAVKEVAVRGPRGTFVYRPNPVDVRGGTPRGGADYLGCDDVTLLDVGRSIELTLDISNRTLPRLALEPGQPHQLSVVYSTECLKATWRGSLNATATFTPD